VLSMSFLQREGCGLYTKFCLRSLEQEEGTTYLRLPGEGVGRTFLFSDSIFLQGKEESKDLDVTREV
jgi:hypothetical protein